MDVSLVLVMPDGRQQEVPLRRPVQVVGRQTDCQIRIPSGDVSRHHCEIAVGGESVSVRDLGSSNGTFVNKRRVTQTDVQAGDLIAVGDMVFVVRVDGRPSHINADDVLEDGQVRPAEPAPKAAAKAEPKAAAGKPPRRDASDDSSVADFDFLNEDDDIKKQPKL